MILRFILGIRLFTSVLLPVRGIPVMKTLSLFNGPFPYCFYAPIDHRPDDHKSR
jgi:hypothetical protein